MEYKRTFTPQLVSVLNQVNHVCMLLTFRIYLFNAKCYGINLQLSRTVTELLGSVLVLWENRCDIAYISQAVNAKVTVLYTFEMQQQLVQGVPEK